MKTAHEVLLEAVRLRDSGGSCEPAQLLELIADLARVVVELEHHTRSSVPIPAESSGDSE